MPWGWELEEWEWVWAWEWEEWVHLATEQWVLESCQAAVFIDLNNQI